MPAEPVSAQSLFSHCELAVHAPPSGRSVTQVGIAAVVSQNVFASKHRWPVMQAWPVVGLCVHFIAVVSHG